MAAMIVPSFRQHRQSGNFFVEWGKRVRYLGKLEGPAREKYALEIEAWQKWKGAKQAPAAQPKPKAPEPQREEPGIENSPLVLVVVQKLIDSVRAEGGDSAAFCCSERIEPFLKAFGNRPIGTITEIDLLDFREKLLATYRNPNTANARLCSSRRLLTFARRFVSKPFPVESLKNTKRKRPPAKAKSYKEVAALINAVSKVNPGLSRCLRLSWLCCLRPSELPRLIQGQGTWHPLPDKAQGKVFIPTVSKCQGKGQERYICVPKEAVELLAEIQTKALQGNLYQTLYSGMSSYQQACSKLAQYSIHLTPHFLRHSSATCLSVNLEAGRDVVETALGHAQKEVSGIYYPPNFVTALRVMRGLAKLVPIPPEMAERTVTRGKTNKEGKSVTERAKERSDKLLKRETMDALQAA